LAVWFSCTLSAHIVCSLLHIFTNLGELEVEIHYIAVNCDSSFKLISWNQGLNSSICPFKSKNYSIKLLPKVSKDYSNLEVRRHHFGLNFLHKFVKNFNWLALTTANNRHCDFEVRLCSWDGKIKNIYI